VRYFFYDSAESIARLKRPTRGGQNLTDRHRRLEKSLRGKEARLKQIDDLPRSLTSAQPSSVPKRPALNTFQGFVIPEQPKPPEPDGTPMLNNYSSRTYAHMYRVLHVRMCNMYP
jgi:hypothetical protein